MACHAPLTTHIAKMLEMRCSGPSVRLKRTMPNLRQSGLDGPPRTFPLYDALPRHKIHCDAVHAISFAGWFRAVVKHMAQMTTAPRAMHLGTRIADKIIG
jgi:hypothetical protein